MIHKTELFIGSMIKQILSSLKHRSIRENDHQIDAFKYLYCFTHDYERNSLVITVT
jgi:hypothetical protein